LQNSTHCSHAECLHIFNESNKEILINGTNASALVLSGLTNVVQMYETAIDRFMAQLTATSNWGAAGMNVTDHFLIGALWVILALQHTIGSSGIKSGHRAVQSQVALRFFLVGLQ
jgi:hypothetical protein